MAHSTRCRSLVKGVWREWYVYPVCRAVLVVGAASVIISLAVAVKAVSYASFIDKTP